MINGRHIGFVLIDRNCKIAPPGYVISGDYIYKENNELMTGEDTVILKLAGLVGNTGLIWSFNTPDQSKSINLIKVTIG